MLMMLLGIAISLAAVAVIFVIVYFLVLVRPPKRTAPDEILMRDYAHRGLHGENVPENSLTAFENACKAGYGIELDVQLSRDGVVMVFHDYSLLRMTGRDQKLSELDAAELTAICLMETTETVPTFEQVLELVDGRVPLLVELKGEELDVSLCEKVAELLGNYKGAYCIESFNPLLVGNMKKRSLLNIALTAMALNVVARPDFIAYNKEDRASLPVKISTGLYRAPKFVWTVNTREELDTAHKNSELAIFENIF